MENAFSALRYCTENANDGPKVDLSPTTDVITTMSALCTVLPSTCRSYDVFISHAGEDKATIAMPLRDKLREQGITAFVDEADMQPGTVAKPAMINAMETAGVAVIVLSPEFIAKEWPMKELMCFLRRRDESNSYDRGAPVIIPLFYRISISELHNEPRFDRKDKKGLSLYDKSRFYERQRRGEPEANIEAIKSALMKVCGIMGVRNDLDASNDSSYLMSFRRELLLQQLCDNVRQAITSRALQLRPEDQGANTERSQEHCDRFRMFFPPLSSDAQAVLDFRDHDGNPKTTEGLVRQKLLQGKSDFKRIVSLHGIGGVGKSTILQALSNDTQIRTTFSDGVHVIKLRKKASCATLLRQIYRVLKESGAEKTYQSLRTENDVEEAMAIFENWFEGRNCALFIDDAWEHGIGLALLSRLCKIGSGVGCNSVLITTREHGIASLAPSEKTVELKPREVRGLLALNILLFHSSRQEMDLLSVHDSVNEILDICRGLPVSLAVAGKNVKKMSISMPNDKEGVWKQYLSQLVICREKLLRQDVENYENLFATLATSISYLDEKPQEVTLGFSSTLSFAEMYRRLCVLEKQAVVPFSMLKHLWSAENDKCAEVIATAFVEAGLASREAAIVGGEYDHLSIHDSLHDFAVAEAKRTGEIKNAHNCLLNGYKSSGAQTSCEWWSEELEMDWYIHRNVCRHLVEAGRIAELLQLLLSPQWVGRQLEVNDILILQADFSLGVKAIQEGLRDETGKNYRDVEKALELISDAAALSSTFISSNRAELCFQLHGRLKGCAKICRTIDDYVCRIEAEDRRPRLLCTSSSLRQVGGSNAKIISIRERILCFAMMKDEERMVCGCRGGRVFVVNMKRSIIENQWIAHDSRVNAIAVGKTETRLISGSNDKTARVWSVETSCGGTSFTGHSDLVSDIAVMTDGTRVISVSVDGTAIIWDIETGNILSELRTPDVLCVAVLPGEEDLVVTGGSDGKLRIWNVATDAQVGGTLDCHDDWISCIAVTPDGQYLVSGSDDLTVRVWDVRSHQQVGNSLKGHTRRITCVAVSGDGSRLVSGSDDWTVRVWDLNTCAQICAPLEGHTSFVTDVIFLDGTDRIVSSSEDGTLRVWDLTHENSNNFTNRDEFKVSGVAFSPDGSFVVSASHDRTLHIWDTTSGQQLGPPLKGHADSVTDVAITPNGQCAVSVSYDKSIRVWAFESRELLYTLTGHTDRVRCVAVTPNGDHIITGSDDHTVRVWGLATMEGSPVVFEGHNASVQRVFVSDDGLRVVSIDSWDVVFVWELRTKERVQGWKIEDAWRLSRNEVLSLLGEMTVRDHTVLLIPLWGREIMYGEGLCVTVLATMESDIESWALSPEKKTICVGMHDGQVGFLKLETS